MVERLRVKEPNEYTLGECMFIAGLVLFISMSVITMIGTGIALLSGDISISTICFFVASIISSAVLSGIVVYIGIGKD